LSQDSLPSSQKQLVIFFGFCFSSDQCIRAPGPTWYRKRIARNWDISTPASCFPTHTPSPYTSPAQTTGTETPSSPPSLNGPDTGTITYQIKVSGRRRVQAARLLSNRQRAIETRSPSDDREYSGPRWLGMWAGRRACGGQ
jgi:hypothetical protein